ncbi:uncharacterized protein F5891DRAFT_983207 [Suillus fuscotomentosus]|uniref:Uncharacterized protein n=1 Tax=Suillus fuscotomentosus TaxID=1912939 RepID=A0AAD4HGI1_9AGAM|nr:uncharacterized protein F5891DRAFT_983207 [Suillus fuscotomentosus]KAG1896790.1 hypothetical protein F5891DRAFT_983207 [Suillus fuscotomentosus]
MARHKRSDSITSSDSSASSRSLNSVSPVDPLPSKKVSKKATRPKKRRRSSDNDEKRARKKESDIDPDEEFLAAACCIARCIDVFCLALQQRDAAENGDLSEDEDTQACRETRLSKISPQVQEQYKRNYARLLRLAPSLKPLLGDPRKASELNDIIKKMDATISGTRSDDASRLKSQIGHYVAFNTKDHPIRPAIYDGSGSRTHLGINHPVLARFLCPVRELKRFSEDADKALKDIQCGKVNLTASALPAFLWAGDPPGQEYDDDNMFEGMFDGYLLERTMRHIFTSPLSAYGGETRATRTCNATLHDMTTVEAAHISYGCLQVRFGISAKNAWSEIDGAFNYREFYNNIIELIEDSPDPEWKEDLLKAWNVKIFKNEEGRDSNGTRDNEKTSGSRESRDTDLARVRAQMAAHRAAKAVPTPAPSTHEPTPAPPREPTPLPPREPTPAPPALPARAKSHALSDLTEAEDDEDSERVPIKRKGKKAGGRSKRKAPASTAVRKSSRK